MMRAAPRAESLLTGDKWCQTGRFRCWHWKHYKRRAPLREKRQARPVLAIWRHLYHVGDFPF